MVRNETELFNVELKSDKINIMKHIVFTGPANTGKTTLVNQTARELINLGFKRVEYNPILNHEKTYQIPNNQEEDFFILLERNGMIILCYSWSDTEELINWLKKLLDRLKSNDLSPELVIMASREASEDLYEYTNIKLKLNNNNKIFILPRILK